MTHCALTTPFFNGNLPLLQELGIAQSLQLRNSIRNPAPRPSAVSAQPYTKHMIVLRLTRVGKKKQPTFRLVAQDKQKDPWGKALEILGHYNPRSNPKSIVFKADRIKAWLEKGAKPSPSVHNLLIDAKIVAGEKTKATKGARSAGTKDAKKTEEVKK